MESKQDYFSDDDDGTSENSSQSSSEDEEEVDVAANGKPGLDDEEEETEATKHQNALERKPIDARSLHVSLKDLFSTGEMADVAFDVGRTEEEKTTIYAHKLILAAASPVFEHMLYAPEIIEAQSSGDAKHRVGMPHEDPPLPGDRQRDEGQMPHIVVKHTSPRIFRLLLEVVYFNQTDLAPLDIPELLVCAEKYRVERGIVACRTILKSGVSKHNACLLFHVAVQISSRVVFNHVVKFISTHSLRCVQSKAFEHMAAGTLKLFLSLDCLQINEIVLFKAVLRWAAEEAKRCGRVFDGQARDEILAEILPYIRFPLIKPENFSRSVLTTGVLSDDVALQIFKIYLERSKTKSTSQQETSSLAYYSAEPRNKKFGADTHLETLLAVNL